MTLRARPGSTWVTAAGTVPMRFPQTAAAAEYIGFVEAVKLLRAPLEGFGDNMAVVKDAQLGQEAMLKPSRLYGGILRQALPAIHRVAGVHWTRGHAREKMTADAFGALSEEELWRVLGNEAADRLADSGREAHPQPSEATRRSTGALVQHLRRVMACAVAVLPLWPRLTKGYDRVPTVTTSRPRSIVVTHDWGALKGGWHRCKACFAACRPCNIAKLKPCNGAPPFGDKLHPTHCVRWHSAGDSNVAICLTCGAWAEKKAVLLARPCKNLAASFRKKGLKRVANGWHPDDRKQVRLD